MSFDVVIGASQIAEFESFSSMSRSETFRARGGGDIKSLLVVVGLSPRFFGILSLALDCCSDSSHVGAVLSQRHRLNKTVASSSPEEHSTFVGTAIGSSSLFAFFHSCVRLVSIGVSETFSHRSRRGRLRCCEEVPSPSFRRLPFFVAVLSSLSDATSSQARQ